MHIRARVLAVVVGVAGSVSLIAASGGCTLVPSEADDGGGCSEDKGCKSRRCSEGYCQGSTCSRSNSSSSGNGSTSNKSSCDEGWRCVHHDADPITGFFGATGSDLCSPTCGHCPGNTYCPKEGIPNETGCVQGKAPIELTLTATPAKGTVKQPIKVVATVTPTAVAATETLTKCRWSVDDTTPEQEGTTEFTQTFEQARTYTFRATCNTNDPLRTSSGQVQVEVTE